MQWSQYIYITADLTTEIYKYSDPSTCFPDSVRKNAARVRDKDQNQNYWAPGRYKM